jgi:hypothetical protein
MSVEREEALGKKLAKGNVAEHPKKKVSVVKIFRERFHAQREQKGGAHQMNKLEIKENQVLKMNEIVEFTEAADRLLNEFMTSDLKKSIENGFIDVVKSKKPKEYFVVPFVLEKSKNVAIFYPCDVENYRTYRRKREKAVGHWLGIIITLEDGEKVYMYKKSSRDGWVIIAQAMLVALAKQYGMDENQSFEDLLMNYLLNTKEDKGMVIRDPQNPNLLAMPKSSDPMVYFQMGTDEALQTLACAVGMRICHSPEVDLYTDWSNMYDFLHRDEADTDGAQAS